MNLKNRPKLAISYLKYSTSVLGAWPISSTATNTQKTLADIKWWILFLISWLALYPLLYTCYKVRNDFMELTRFICFASSIAHGTIKMVIFRVYRRECQELFEEMEEHINRGIPKEHAAMDACVGKAGPVHLTFNLIGLVVGISFSCGPLVMDQDLPTEMIYPFEIDYYPVFHLVYASQSIAAVQGSAVGPVDASICMLIWFSIARLRVLADSMRSVSNIDDLKDCIQRHQDILRFHKKVVVVAAPIIITTVSMATISTVSGGVHIVGHEEPEIKAQLVGLELGYIVMLFPSAWAAETLTKAVEDAKWALYDSPWLQSSKKTNKLVIFILHRLNSPPKFTVAGLIPELSLGYYAVYLSKTMSFFTTLRIMVQKIEDAEKADAAITT